MEVGGGRVGCWRVRSMLPCGRCAFGVCAAGELVNVTDGDDCAAIECLNGGRCVDLRFDYRCDCTPGYIGRVCEGE